MSCHWDWNYSPPPFPLFGSLVQSFLRSEWELFQNILFRWSRALKGWVATYICFCVWIHAESKILGNKFQEWINTYCWPLWIWVIPQLPIYHFPDHSLDRVRVYVGGNCSSLESSSSNFVSKLCDIKKGNYLTFCSISQIMCNSTCDHFQYIKIQLDSEA